MHKSAKIDSTLWIKRRVMILLCLLIIAVYPLTDYASMPSIFVPVLLVVPWGVLYACKLPIWKLFGFCFRSQTFLLPSLFSTFSWIICTFCHFLLFFQTWYFKLLYKSSISDHFSKCLFRTLWLYLAVVQVGYFLRKQKILRWCSNAPFLAFILSKAKKKTEKKKKSEIESSQNRNKC